jgi:predicted tellurium resistance membrane protein TerC
VLSSVVKAIFALWSLEIACVLSNLVLIVIAISMLLKKHLTSFKQTQRNDCEEEALFNQSLTMSRCLKWSAVLAAVLSSILWTSAAFSFAIARYFDETCVGMEHASPAYSAVQSFLFGPSS